MSESTTVFYFGLLDQENSETAFLLNRADIAVLWGLLIEQGNILSLVLRKDLVQKHSEVIIDFIAGEYRKPDYLIVMDSLD